MKARRPLSATATARTDPAILARLGRRSVAAGSFSGPCLPALLDHYAQKLTRLFELIDRPLSGPEIKSFRDMLAEKLAQGFAASPYARFVFSYRPMESNPMAVGCEVSILAPSLEEQYDEWVKGLDGAAPFGTHPDAKVLDVAAELASAGPLTLLDAGAGSGRNALPLARRGHAVDALEPVPVLAGELERAARAESLPLRVIAGDLLEPATDIGAGRYGLVVASEVLPHFATADLEQAFEKLARALAPGGTLLVNAFVARAGYQPDALARQAAQSVWSSFCRRDELRELGERSGLELAGSEPAVDYEQRHLPAQAWPPTSWYVNWARGHNLFAPGHGPSPIELCWLVFRRAA